MKNAMIAMMTMAMAVTGGRAWATSGVPCGLSREPRVIAAMTKAWMRTKLSQTTDAEAGFRIDHAEDGYAVVPQEAGKLSSRQTELQLVPGITMAIYHVHPSHSDPGPSAADRKIGDTYGVQVYIMHVSGLYVYDPSTKQTTKLCDDTSWLKP